MKRWLIGIEVAGVSRETLCWQGLQGSTACYDLIFSIFGLARYQGTSSCLLPPHPQS